MKKKPGQDFKQLMKVVRQDPDVAEFLDNTNIIVEERDGLKVLKLIYLNGYEKGMHGTMAREIILPEAKATYFNVKKERQMVKTMFPLLSEVPEGEQQEGWRLINCAQCGRQCWRTPDVDELYKLISSIKETCKECAITKENPSQ